jgi:DNA-binding CsgD family transcriptional regulator
VARDVLEGSPFPALVLEVPSEKIVASSAGAAELLAPDGGPVVGKYLENFTSDRPTAGVDLFAGGRLNGFEAFRVLRRARGADLKVRMWIRTFDHQPSSNFVLVVVVADQVAPSAPHSLDRPVAPAVVGTADASLMIERVSSDAETLFGWSAADLVGRSLISVIAEHDVPSCLAGIDEASGSQNGVALYLDVRSNIEGSESQTASLGCEVLLLPLQPSPSCAFVFLPTQAELSRTPISGDLSAILGRLGRGAEVAQLVRGVTGGMTDRDLPGLSSLTTRELEVLTRLVDGDRVPAIAAELFLTQSTVRNHLASIFNKVGVTSQQQLLNVFRAAHSRRVGPLGPDRG